MRLVLLLFMISCSQVQPKRTKVQFSHDVYVQQNNQKLLIRRDGNFIPPNGEMTKISAPGKVSLLLYPYGKKTDLKISLPNMDESQIEKYQVARINETFDELMPEIHQVQRFILKKDYNNALSKIRDLKIKYPEIAYLSFLEGACYSVLGKTVDAKKALQEGFHIFPNSASAKQLYRSLSGEKY